MWSGEEAELRCLHLHYFKNFGHGWNESWPNKSILAYLIRVSSGQQVRFCMSRISCDQKRKFQHVRNLLW
jgi:hypothetical protein